MEKLDIYSWVGHGGPLGGLSLRTLLWTAVLRPLGGIIGTNQRMKEPLASMSTGAQGLVPGHQAEWLGVENCLTLKQSSSSHTRSLIQTLIDHGFSR